MPSPLGAALITLSLLTTVTVAAPEPVAPTPAAQNQATINVILQQKCQHQGNLTWNDLLALATNQLTLDNKINLDTLLQEQGYAAKNILVWQVDKPRSLEQMLAFLFPQPNAEACKTMRDNQWQDFALSRKDDHWTLIVAIPFTLKVGNVATEVLQWTNAARAQARNCGNKFFSAAPPLRLSDKLNQVGQIYTEDLATHDFFSHTGRDGSTPSERISKGGYPWQNAGENLAMGPDSAQEVVDGWVHSPGHCANLMSPDFQEMGAAIAVNLKTKGKTFWAQVFATPQTQP